MPLVKGQVFAEKKYKKYICYIAEFNMRKNDKALVYFGNMNGLLFYTQVLHSIIRNLQKNHIFQFTAIDVLPIFTS